MARDGWKYYDEDESMEEGEEDKKPLPLEKQCPHCLHWVERDIASCPWCGKIFGDRNRGQV